MKNKLYAKPKQLLVISSIVFVLVLAASVVLFVLGFFTELPFIAYISFVLLPLAGAFLLFSILNYAKNDNMLRTLQIENQYQLGIGNYFFNYQMFSERVKKLRRKHDLDKTYVIAFSVYNILSSGTISSYQRRLNGYIASFIGAKVFQTKMVNPNDIAFCFHRNVFIVYSFMDLDKTRELIEILRKAIYEIVKEKELKVFVQPHFGVAEILPTTDIIVGVDNAIFARNVDERNFEELTFYKDDFRVETNKDEIEEIRDALKNNEFVVYYQPKFDVSKKKFVGFEALIRWNSPRYGLLLPGRFIEKAEIGGLIHELDMFVLRQVIKDLENLKARNMNLLPVSVNFSLYEFYSSAFLTELIELIDRSALKPELIEIEITETTTQANTFMATSILNRLRNHGLKILMDDFGSGFSNLLQLNSLPFDAVKIDKCLIDGVASDPKTKEIVKLVIGLCKANQLGIVAEGVDSKEKVDVLTKMGCDVIQGFYYSEPLSLLEALEFLDDNPFTKKGGSKK
ncbi:MAG: EAL domain-containing protein [Bacilli bacterium]|nr:EAL domain-containing protein [Bacilli bacterium]